MKAKDEEGGWEWKVRRVGGSGRSPLRRDGCQISKAGMCCVSIHTPARTG